MSVLVSMVERFGDVPAAVLVLALTCLLGKLLGSVKMAGIRLGGAGVLFAGLALGHFGFTVQPSILAFARELGLILFVYAIGVTVGPGFFSSLRSTGLRLNAIAAGLVLTGVALTVLISKLGGVPMPVAVGLFSGATTNIPSLSAATQTLTDHPATTATSLSSIAQADPEKAARLAALPDSATLLATEAARIPGLATAVAYPFGILGIILSMLAVRAFLGRKGRSEDPSDAEGVTESVLETRTFEVTNSGLAGRKIGEISLLQDLDLVVSRIRKGGVSEIARKDHVLETGDLLLAVGTPKGLEQFQILVGTRSEIDLRETGDALESRWMVLTEKSLVGKTSPQLRLVHRAGVRTTRVRRGELELLPTTELKLNYGDQLRIVGTPDCIERAGAILGNQPKHLEHPDVAMLFLGLVVGVLVGMIPIAIPGMPVAVKLGLGGGPMLVAILLGRIHRVGNVVAHLPVPAAIMLKDFGISLFLAAVGLLGGGQFVRTLASGAGLSWMLWGALVTLLPMAIWIVVARTVFQFRFGTLAGLMAGSTTNPPALDFAHTLSSSQDAAVAYATVYPLTMILRIVAAQVMVLLFVG